MIRLNVQRFGTIRTLALSGLLAIGAAASTTTPPLAQNSGSWANTGKMNVARENHTATLLQNGQDLVAGGFNNTLTIASAELHDPKVGKWTLSGSMNTTRQGHTATLLQSGEVLVVGGGNPTTNMLASAELYNPSTGNWTFTSSISAARAGYTATLLPNGQVLVAGGFDSNSVDLSSAKFYNPATGYLDCDRQHERGTREPYRDAPPQRPCSRRRRWQHDRHSRGQRRAV